MLSKNNKKSKKKQENKTLKDKFEKKVMIKGMGLGAELVKCQLLL